MSGVVIFDVAKFREIYTKITATDAQLQSYFVESTMLMNNTEQSCVQNLSERELLLFLLVAHIALLQGRIDSGNDSVGRIASASEGSVSVGLDNGQTTQAEKWYQQTPYGARYWALTAKYRSFLYIVTNIAMPVKR